MQTVFGGKHWLSGLGMELTVENGRVVSCRASDQEYSEWIGPGLFDIQVNGTGGFDLNDGHTTVDTVKHVVHELHKSGVTRFCPTITTGTKDRILHGVGIIAQACKVDPLVDYAVAGIHVEGPFISELDGPRGAHNRDWVRDPDWQEFLEWQEAAEGRICKVTLAPEKPGALDFICRLHESGVVAAIGHSSATEEEIRQAVEAGATMSTHLGNGAHPYIKRHPNYIWAQMAEDRLWAGLIADGHHLPLSTLKVMLRAKGRKAIITSDAVSLAGMPPGRYTSHSDIEVVLEPNGFLHLASTPDILAGSATPLDRALEVMAANGLCELGEAIAMASLHPAEMLGLDRGGIGRLDVGSPADFIIYKYNNAEGFKILQTFSNGQCVYDLFRK